MIKIDKVHLRVILQLVNVKYLFEDRRRVQLGARLDRL